MNILGDNTIMKKFLFAVAATVAMAAPAQAQYTCKSAMEIMLTDLEEATAIMESVNLAAPNASDIKRLNEAAEVLGRNQYTAGRWLNDPENDCRKDPEVLALSERAKSISRRITGFYREVMSDPKMMMLMFQSGSAK